MSGKDNPQLLLAAYRQPARLAEINRSAAPLWLVAQALRDPGNIGTILRTGDAVGAGGLILVDDSADPFSVEAVRASMGAIFTQSVATARWEEFLPWLRSGPGQLVGTSLKTNHDYIGATYEPPCFILIGNEQQGLPADYEAACDLLVKIPMAGRADSLNAAIAAAVTAAAPMEGGALLVTDNERSVTRTVRRHRARLGAVMGLSILLSILLSLFLARTIVRPLRRIALAAHRVRLGRAREVRVPRLPSRGDEIGLLARSVSDMSQSLRQRIDNIEHFAADVTHELKNPIASLRSALDGAETMKDAKLRQRLIAVARDDVLRLDRLISDIGEAARTDAELARARFEEVDLGPLIEQLVASWDSRRDKGDARVAYARPRKQSTIVLGDAGRLARAFDNVIDNAISFSPAGGLVEIAASRVGSQVRIRIDDEGPGVPPEAREAIFNRFHSIRPEAEDFGRHSGLGLAIAKAIVEGHDGDITVQDRDDAPSGARFVICLPALEDR